MSSQPDIKFVAGITPRSLLASVFCMLLAGMYTQYSEVILAEGHAVAEQVLPVPAMSVLLLMLVLCGGVYSLAKIRLLTRAEMLCVLFSMLFSIPLMTQGMWHRFVALISSPVRTASFEYLDAYNDNLWPHGENLLAGGLPAEGVEFAGNGELGWEKIEYQEGQFAVLPRLTNQDAEGETWLVLRVPVARGGRGGGLVPTNPHLVSVLARSEAVGPESQIFGRVFADDATEGNELFSVRRADRKTYIHKQGFERLGRYGAVFSDRCREHLRLELGLRGRGSVVFADPKLMSVAAIEGIYRGRRLITQAEYDQLAEDERPVDVVIKPDNLWSLGGLRFLISGYIPLREWVRPALTWSAFVLLLSAACFAVNVIMRRQWAESERYSFPNARIPFALIGGEDEHETGAFADIWRNRFMWAGLGVALFWGLVKGANAYNSKVPDLNIAVNLGPYFQDPSWGGMWNTTFIVSIFVVSIAIFFELNVLLSLVLGFWLFRSLFWFGQVTDMRVHAGFPWRYEQAIGGYLGYFLIVLFFTRKYLWRVLRQAVKGEAGSKEEIFSSRTAVLVLIGCFAGAMAWGVWLDVSLATIVVYFGFLVMLGFVSAKMRAECGLPGGYFTPYNAMLAVSIFGGMSVFGANGMLVSLLLSGFLSVTVFFFVPGAQIELIHLGRRLNIQPRHLTYTCLIGILGGLFIGGWVFLANAYAIGGDNIKYQWSFSGLHWFFGSYKSELANTTTSWLRGAEAPLVGPNWGLRTVMAWGGVTMLLTVVRQFFSGFWFHPVGFILGSSHMMTDFAWGSVLTAWVIRSLVLKFGGATSVRHKLQPFFIGAFVGSVLVLVLFLFINSWSAASGSPNMYRALP